MKVVAHEPSLVEKGFLTESLQEAVELADRGRFPLRALGLRGHGPSLRWRKMTDIFLLTKPPASPRARLYLFGDEVYNLLGEIPPSISTGTGSTSARRDMYARGVIAREAYCRPRELLRRHGLGCHGGRREGLRLLSN